MNRRIADDPPHGRPSLLARVAGWLIVPLYVAGVCMSYVLQRRAGLPNEHPVEDALLWVGFGAFAVVGALLVAKPPTNAIGWIMATVALMVAIFHAGGTYAAYVMTTRDQPDVLTVVGAWVQAWYWWLVIVPAIIYLPLLFPDGRLPSRRWLPVAILPGIGTLSLVVLGALKDTLLVEDVHYRIDNPIGIKGLGFVEDLPVFGLINGLLIVGLVGAAASVVVRFRRSRGVERQQMKWFVYAAALILLAPVVDQLPDVVNGVWLALVLIATSTAIGIAVLRYRLYGIDVVINRTLVYGPLTAMLVLVYLGGVVFLQYAFRILTGQGSQIAIVASTLAIAALFNPLRRRIQAFVDRRFYRRKYDAAKTLEAFSTKLRDETDLGALNAELVSVVRQTMQPANVLLWLRPDPSPKSSGGEEPREPHHEVSVLRFGEGARVRRTNFRQRSR
jgi:hypothetical protein